MRRVSLLSVEMMGFKCFRDPIKVKLSPGPGFKSLTGDNQAEPSLGANGAGKSSFLDAIFFCLYGTGLKGQKASALTTWHADIRPWVKTIWKMRRTDERGFHIVEIERAGSPDKLLLNGQPASQEDVDRIMGLTKVRFRHAIIFGQNVEFFAQLSTPDRSALMEEVCDLSLWQRAADEAADEERKRKAEADEHTREILRFETRLESLPSLKKLRAELEQWRSNHAAEIAQAKKASREAKGEEEALASALQELPEPQHADKAEGRLKEARAHRRETEDWVREITRVLKEKEEALVHLTMNPTCPTCKQDWPDAGARMEQLTIEIRRTKKLQAKNASALEAATAAEEEIELALTEARQAHEKLITKAAEMRGALSAQKRLAASLKARLAEIEGQDDAKLLEEIESVRRNRAHYKAQIDERTLAKQKAEGKAQLAGYWKSTFKQVRLFQMKRVLQHLELEIEAAMNSLGLRGWKIGLATETETKSGTFKHGVQIQVTSPKASAPWESWSGGEGQRLTLAIAIGFSNLVQRMAGVRYSFEFWDEPSAWLSAEGIEDMVATLRERAEREKLSLWLVDHRSLGDAFDETWVIRKDEETAYVEQI